MSRRRRHQGTWLALAVLASVLMAPLLLILRAGLGIMVVGLSMGRGSNWWAYVIYYGGTASLVALDVYIGYGVWRYGSDRERSGRRLVTASRGGRPD